MGHELQFFENNNRKYGAPLLGIGRSNRPGRLGPAIVVPGFAPGECSLFPSLPLLFSFLLCPEHFPVSFASLTPASGLSRWPASMCSSPGAPRASDSSLPSCAPPGEPTCLFWPAVNMSDGTQRRKAPLIGNFFSLSPGAGQKKLEAAQKEVQKARRGNYETVQVLTCDVSKSDAGWLHFTFAPVLPSISHSLVQKQSAKGCEPSSALAWSS